jgi:hypothetical protein
VGAARPFFVCGWKSARQLDYRPLFSPKTEVMRMSPSQDLPWFRRFGPDGKPEPVVLRGHCGEIAMIDANGWAASFKDGKWHSGILWQHLQLAEFSPVQSRDEVYRLYDEARAVVGSESK